MAPFAETYIHVVELINQGYALDDRLDSKIARICMCLEYGIFPGE